MKKFILALIIVGLGIGLYMYLQPQKPSNVTKPIAKTLNSIKVAFDADPVSLDPHVQLSAGMIQYAHMVFDPLIRWNQQGGFEGRLATKWERIDPLTVRFHLREGVKFHSGNLFTAKDVAWTLARLKKSQDFKALFEAFDAPVIIDDYTIDIKTKKPYALLENMSTYIFPMDSVFYTGKDAKGMDKDTILKTAYSFANENESGTGKYKVTFREQGVKMVFTKFADYWDTTGNVDEIVLTPISNDATRVAALLSGDVDFIMPVPPQDYERVKGNKDLKLVTMSGSRIITFQLNQKKRPEFQNKKVRQAMVYAVNNAGIVDKIMKGTASAAAQQAPEGFAGYKASLTARFDLEKAKQLMKEAGYPDGFSCSMIAPNNRYVKDEQIAQSVATMLSKIGIKVNLKTMPKAQYWDQYDAQAGDIQMIGWHPDTEDSSNYTEFLLMCPNKETGYGQYNSGNYCNPKVDELIMKAMTETDLAKRSAMLQEVEQITYDDAAYIPMHWENLSWASKSNLMIETIVNIQNFPYFGDLVAQ